MGRQATIQKTHRLTVLGKLFIFLIAIIGLSVFVVLTTRTEVAAQTCTGTACWDYNNYPSFSSSSGSSTVYPGDTITISSYSQNVCAATGCAGLAYTLQLVNYAGEGSLTNTGYSSGCSWVNGGDGTNRVVCEMGALSKSGLANSTSATNTATWRVNTGAVAGTSVCFRSRINNHFGQATPTPKTVLSTGWEVGGQTCFTVGSNVDPGSCTFVQGDPSSNFAGLWIQTYWRNAGQARTVRNSATGMTITATTNPPYSDGTDGILNGKNVRAPNTTTYVSYSWTAGISPTQGTPGVVLLGWGSCSESWKLDCDTSYRLARPATYGGTPYNPQQDFTITVSGTPSGVATGGYWEYNYDQYRAGVNDSNLWYRSNSAIVGPANGQYDILEFQYVAPAAVTNWNYVPKIATTPSAGTVSPGSTITVSTRAQNTPATMTGADHGHRIRISSGSENVTVISNSGDESTSTKPSTIAWGWSGLPGITAGNYSAYKTLSFTVNSNAANGSQVCFEGGVNNRIGDSVNGVTTAEYAFTSSVCFTVSVPVTTSWEYLPQINGAGGTVNPGATIAVTAYNYNSTTSNGETGSGYIQRLNITSNAGLVSVMSGIGNYPADNEPTPGVVWAWGGQPGLAPGANSFSTGKTLYFQVSGSATTGSQICFKSAVNNFTGTNGTTTSAGFRESAYAICYTVNVPAATTFWNYVPSISGTVSGTPAPNGYVLNLDPNNPDVGNSIVIAGNAYNSFTTANNGMTGLNYDLAIAPYGTGADDLIKVAGSATQSGTYWLWSGLPGIPAGGSGTTQALAFRVNVATVTSGDRICFVTGVSPYAGDSVGNISSGTSYSNEICYTINLLPTIDPIRPYLVVNKAGVWAGGAIDNFGAIDPINAPCSGVNLNIVSAITSVADNTLGKGSYADYDVTATGPISGFGSYGSITGTGLTFANDPPLGNFSSEGRCITNFYDLLYDLAAAGYPGISFGGSTLPVYTVPAGADSIILIDGKVTIEGNRTYVTSYTQPGGTGVSSIDQIPFAMVVVNGDIDIKSNVTKLDGLYMATGTIDTCSDAPSTPSGVSIFCNEQLLINGAFIANHINFSRTHGGLHTLARSTDPAEVFQFSPEMYLGAPNIPIPGLGEYTIDQFKDLPAVY